MKKYISAILSMGLIFSSCEKKVDPIDTYNVTVEYRSGSAKYVTGDVTVNPKDSIYFDFTISSPTDMAFIEIQKNGARLDTFRLDNATNKKSFSLVKGYRADSTSGSSVYRVLARNARAVFMGDGGKQFIITVSPDFNFWSDRLMKVPDTVSKVNKCYYSIATGKLYNYVEAFTNSGEIDFGYYYDTTSSQKHTFYALGATQPQLSYYDISTWTKNATVFKKMPSSVNFVSQLTSSGAINTLIKNNMASGTVSKISALATSSGNNVIGFRTASGKYGAILIRSINQDLPAKETAIEIDVKVQK